MNIPEPTMGITIYAKSSCGYCSRAKKLLPEAFVVDCDQYLDKNKDTFLRTMDKLTSQSYRTFPMVFINKRFIGGYQDIKEYIDFNLNEDF